MRFCKWKFPRVINYPLWKIPQYQKSLRAKNPQGWKVPRGEKSSGVENPYGWKTRAARTREVRYPVSPISTLLFVFFSHDALRSLALRSRENFNLSLRWTFLSHLGFQAVKTCRFTPWNKPETASCLLLWIITGRCCVFSGRFFDSISIIRCFTNKPIWRTENQ